MITTKTTLMFFTFSTRACSFSERNNDLPSKNIPNFVKGAEIEAYSHYLKRLTEVKAGAIQKCIISPLIVVKWKKVKKLRNLL